MSEEEKINEKLKELPHMTEEHLEVLMKHGITTPHKLLAALKDKEKWDSIHPELKGIGPKTSENWEKILESGLGEKKTEEKKPGTRPKVKRIVKTVEKTIEPKKEKKPEKEEKPKAEIEEKKEKKEKKAEKEEEEAEEEVEIVEEGEYIPSKKPKLPAKIKDALKKRKIVDDNRPEFYRQEFGRYQKLETGWRKPRGIHSKTRMNMRYRRPMVKVGYRGPEASRGLHPSGFKEVRVCNVDDLKKVSNANRQAVRIAHSVGQRKREKIIEKAEELGIRVLNRGG